MGTQITPAGLKYAAENVLEYLPPDARRELDQALERGEWLDVKEYNRVVTSVQLALQRVTIVP